MKFSRYTTAAPVTTKSSLVRSDSFDAIIRLFSSSMVITVMLTLLLQIGLVAAVYEQVGLEINGERANDELGWSVSMSANGTTFVVGAIGNDGVNGTDSGHVRVYRYNTTINSYTQVGLDIDGESPFDEFGYAVSISADSSTFVVGAVGNDGNGDASGHVRVYKYSSNSDSYAQFGMDINGGAADDELGYSVSISADGSTFVVGAVGNSGHVRVYRYNSTVNSYAQVGSNIKGEAGSDEFGYSVSISADGSMFVVGAVGNNGNGNDSGHVRVYKYNPTINSYAQLGLDIDGEAAGDLFGYSVSISADSSTFVVGAVGNDGNGIDSGHVRVYQFNATINSYAQVGMNIEGEAAGDRFGESVSISGDGTTFVAGSVGNDGTGVFSGNVRVYKYNSTLNSYAQVGLNIEGEAAGDNFGRSASISVDGTTFVVGAPFNIDKGIKSGHVRVFRKVVPTQAPTKRPTKAPTLPPIIVPTKQPTMVPTKVPTNTPTTAPTKSPTKMATMQPTKVPTKNPIKQPTKSPTMAPSKEPVTLSPMATPTASPDNCGLLGLNLFCLRRRQCGLIKRLLNLGNCN